jgi:hypothetical protein
MNYQIRLNDKTELFIYPRQAVLVRETQGQYASCWWYPLRIVWGNYLGETVLVPMRVTGIEYHMTIDGHEPGHTIGLRVRVIDPEDQDESEKD